MPLYSGISAGLTYGWRIDVQVEAVFTLFVEKRQKTLQVLQATAWHSFESLGLVVNVWRSLWANWRETIRHADAFPLSRRSWRHKSHVADRRRSVRNPQENFDRL